MLVAAYRGIFLYGNSGVGKSSLVNAGLLPNVVRDGGVFEHVRVQPRAAEEIVLEPSEINWNARAQRSVKAIDGQAALRTVLSVEDYEQHVRTVCMDDKVLLIFDHFEDMLILFDDRRAEDIRAHIIDMIVRLLRDQALSVKLLFVFREDYLGGIRELLAAYPNLTDWSLRLSPPKTNELWRIIRGPFERYPTRYPREISPALAQQLCAVLAERFQAAEVSLPEVQTLCLRLWQAEQPERLLLDKGLQGILEEYLDDELNALPTETRRIAVMLLSQMVTTAGTRNVVSAEDLFQRAGADDGTSKKLFRETLHQLDQKSRLLRSERRRDLLLYEITSEFLVPWISDLRDRLRLSLERRRERRRRLVLSSVVVSAALLSIILATLAGWAISQRDTAKREALISRREATSATSLALLSVAQEQFTARPYASLLLAFDSYQSSPHEEARNFLVSSLEKIRSSGATGFLHGHTDMPESVAFSPNGRLLVSGGDEGTMRLWNVPERRQLWHVSIGSRPVRTVTFSPDGTRLVAADTDGTVSLWDLRTHTQLGNAINTHADELLTLSFSPDGKEIATGDLAGGVRFWSTTNHQEQGRPIKLASGVSAIAFSPDGRLLASGSYQHRIRIWDARTHKPMGRPLIPTTSMITEIAFSPDGHTLATLATELFSQGRVELWDTVTHKQLRSAIGGLEEIHGFAFSPDGQAIACGGNGGTTLWSAKTGRELRRSLSSDGHVTSVAVSPDGTTVASGVESHLVELSRVHPVRQFAALGQRGDRRDKERLLAFSPNERDLVSINSHGDITDWNADEPRHEPVHHIPSETGHCWVISPTGHSVAFEDHAGEIQLWSAESARLQARLTPNPPLVDTDSEFDFEGSCSGRLAFSADGKYLAAIAGSADDEVRMWDTTDHTQVDRLQVTEKDRFDEITFDSWGHTLISVSEEEASTSDSPSAISLKHIQVWDWANHRQLGRTLSIKANVGRVVYTQSAHTLALISIANEADDAGGVLLWNMATGRRLGALPLDHGLSVSYIVLDPDGRTLVSVSGNEGGEKEIAGEIRLWDLVTHKPLGTAFSTQFENIHSLTFCRPVRRCAGIYR